MRSPWIVVSSISCFIYSCSIARRLCVNNTHQVCFVVNHNYKGWSYRTHGAQTVCNCKIQWKSLNKKCNKKVIDLTGNIAKPFWCFHWPIYIQTNYPGTHGLAQRKKDLLTLNTKQSRPYRRHWVTLLANSLNSIVIALLFVCWEMLLFESQSKS